MDKLVRSNLMWKLKVARVLKFLIENLVLAKVPSCNTCYFQKIICNISKSRARRLKKVCDDHETFDQKSSD